MRKINQHFSLFVITLQNWHNYSNLKFNSYDYTNIREVYNLIFLEYLVNQDNAEKITGNPCQLSSLYLYA